MPRNPDTRSSTKTSADARRIASEKHDAQFFVDRRAKEASNLEKTLKLKALRLAHEAANPKPAAKPKAARKAPGKTGAKIGTKGIPKAGPRAGTKAGPKA